jgi:hypothetical protein
MNFNFYYALIFGIFAIIAYMVVIDSNVARLITLLPSWTSVVLRSFWVKLTLFPRIYIEHKLRKFKK